MQEIKTLPKVNNNKSLYHSFESHNYWIERNQLCPYCNSGSKPIHKSIIKEKV